MEELLKIRELLKIERDEDFRQYREHFLRNNINHRKKTGLTWYPVIIAKTEIGFGEYLILDIERTSDLDLLHQFKGGKGAALFSNREEQKDFVLNGTIKSVGANTIRLAVQVDELPDWCYEGKLGINLLFDDNSYKEMDKALERVIEAKNNRLAELRDILYGKGPASFKNLHRPFIELLNTSQDEAVRKILAADDVAIVHGPPGTGKTTTLVHAIRETLKQEKQVLVCSPSNTAIDLLTEKLSDQGINVLRLGNPVRVNEKLLSKTLDARITQHPYYSDLKSFRKQAEEYRNIAGKYKRNFGRQEREQRNLLFAEARKILREAEALEEYIVYELFEKTQVIACTLVTAGFRLLEKKNFKTVFIDEAAQALEPACWIPISKAERVIFAGDHFQLPPTVKSKAAEAEGFGKTLFEKCISHQQADVMLNIQYRMHQDIMAFSSHKFYKGELQADISVKNTRLSFDKEDALLYSALDFIDTAGCGFTEMLNPESLSISNPEEAALVLKHLKSLLAEYHEKYPDKKPPSVGVIAPYKEQVEKLEELLLESGIEDSFRERISIKTVDGFQGQERDIIYISLVRSNDKGEIGFLNDIRRMNVALTRARKKLVVTGDSSTLSRHSFYSDFFDYIEQINAYKSAWEFNYL